MDALRLLSARGGEPAPASSVNHGVEVVAGRTLSAVERDAITRANRQAAALLRRRRIVRALDALDVSLDQPGEIEPKIEAAARVIEMIGPEGAGHAVALRAALTPVPREGSS